MRATQILALALTLTAAAAPLDAQTSERTGERQPLGASFTIETLADLPSGANIFSVLDTSIAELVSDRVDAGGLTAAQPARFGAHGSSWTQTMYRVGHVDITDPRASGTPLAVPGIAMWQRMDVASGALAFDTNSPGPVVTLVPLRPARQWTRSFEAFGAPNGLRTRPRSRARTDGPPSACSAAARSSATGSAWSSPPR
jgi:hypothetical protein